MTKITQFRKTIQSLIRAKLTEMETTKKQKRAEKKENFTNNKH